MVRSMMNLTTLPKSFWGYALESAVRIFNMVPTKKVDRTSYEIWHNKAPKLSYLRVWGCEAHVKRDTPEKLDSRSIKCIFVGYPKEMIGYYFYNPLENKIFVARNAEFFENSLTLKEVSGSHGMLEAKHDEIEPNEVESQSVEVPIRRSRRISQAPDRYVFYVDVEEHELGDLNEPPNYKVALSYPEFQMQSMKDN
ncbi:retrotransposon protein, putative, ty1-copia subclass [Tanacetum coccineum]